VASELVRNVWCDVHGDDDRREVPEDGLDVAFRVGSIAVVMDLCADCITEYVTPLAEFLVTSGRKPSNGEAAPAPAAPRPDGAQRLTCPECGKIYSYRNSLASHVREIHGKVLPRLRSAKPVVCPHCGRTFGGGPGLSSHVKSNHPEHWKGPKIHP
jgi:uncharacterized C2H2 Zn-finger protein